MAALSADATGRKWKHDGDVILLPVKATSQIYAGSLVTLVAGYAKAGADAFGEILMGVAENNVLGGASDGLKFVRVRTAGRFEFVAVSGAATNVGKVAYLVFDGTVQVAATTYGVPVGIVTRYLSATLLEVEIQPGLSQALTGGVGAAVGLRVVAGTAAFTTTGATKAVATEGLTTVSFALLTPNAAVAADEILAWTTLTISANTLTVIRTGASKTSALSFSYAIWGV